MLSLCFDIMYCIVCSPAPLFVFIFQISMYECFPFCFFASISHLSVLSAQCSSVSALDLRFIDYSYKELHYFVLVVDCGHAQVTVVCFFIDFGTWVNKTLNLQCVSLGFSHR